MERWFMQRRKNKVLDMSYRQMTIALDTANDLEKAIKAIAEGDVEMAQRIIERLFKVEEEVDRLRRNVFEELTKGSFLHQEREDLMHLIKRLDLMADNIKDSARNVLVLKNADVPKELWSAFHDMSIELVKTATVLKESISNLSENPDKAREISEQVEKHENEVDKQYLEIKSLFLKYDTEIKISILLLLKDLLDFMEEAADSCADTGDYVRLLTVTL